MKKIMIILAILMLVLVNTKEKNIIIPDSAIRFRIVANSNSVEDQLVKNNLEKKLENYLFNIVKDADSSKEAKEKLLNNYTNIDKYVQNYMDLNKINNDYEISIGNNYFPTKVYQGITYDAGYYDSIIVKLGKSQGLNWWCVIYPPLCLIDKENIKDNNVEYTTVVKELLTKYNM